MVVVVADVTVDIDAEGDLDTGIARISPDGSTSDDLELEFVLGSVSGSDGESESVFTETVVLASLGDSVAGGVAAALVLVFVARVVGDPPEGGLFPSTGPGVEVGDEAGGFGDGRGG